MDATSVGLDLQAHLTPVSISTHRAHTEQDFERILEEEPIDAVILGSVTGAPDRGVLARRAATIRPDVAVILMGAEADLSAASSVTEASGWLPVPFTNADAIAVVQQALAVAVDREHALPKQEPTPGTEMVGESRALRVVRDRIDRAARSSATVLIRGESGTGKELVARTIHESSSRRDQPFVKIHCAAIPEPLLESELFGHETGAFTGALVCKLGRFEVAGAGTVFLDEIGDVSLAIQVKLLRVLQDREYERVGGNRVLRVEARFVAATHRNLEQMTASDEFRHDLFYRLNVVSIAVPPLRERKEDIARLASHFCALSCQVHERPPSRFTDDAIALLQAQAWPGNIRQLQNFVERLVVMVDEQTLGRGIVEQALADELGVGESSFAATESRITGLSEAVERAERSAIEKALARSKGRRVVAARLLGISARSLFYKIKQYGLGREE
jgi:two-component system response regulator AtoC